MSQNGLKSKKKSFIISILPDTLVGTLNRCNLQKFYENIP